MRYYKAIAEENLTYKKAIKLAKKLGLAVPRLQFGKEYTILVICYFKVL